MSGTLLIVFCKCRSGIEKKWWDNKKCNEIKQIKKNNSTALLFSRDAINYKTCRSKLDTDVLVLINYYDTVFDRQAITDISKKLGNSIRGFVDCLIQKEKFSGLSPVVYIHQEGLHPCKINNLIITSYSIGGSGPSKKRGDELTTSIKNFLGLECHENKLFQQPQKELDN